MHELSIAQALVDAVLAALQGERARRVVSVQLDLGEHSGVHRDPLEFCFGEVARGTALEGAQLRIHDVPLQLACDDCGRREPAGQFAGRCSGCASPRLEVIAGREIMIRSLELDDDETRGVRRTYV